MITIALLSITATSTSAIELGYFNLKSGMSMEEAKATLIKHYSDTFPDCVYTIELEDDAIILNEQVNIGQWNEYSYIITMNFYNKKLYEFCLLRIGTIDKEKRYERYDFKDYFKERYLMAEKELSQKYQNLITDTSERKVYKKGDLYILNKFTEIHPDIFDSEYVYRTVLSCTDIKLAPAEIKDFFEPEPAPYISIDKLITPEIKGGILTAPADLKLGILKSEMVHALEKKGIVLNDLGLYVVHQTINGKKIRSSWSFRFDEDILTEISFDSQYEIDENIQVPKRTYDELVAHYKSQRPVNQYSEIDEKEREFNMYFAANGQDRTMVWVSVHLHPDSNTIGTRYHLRYWVKMYYDNKLYE